jgi:4-amino-4-deoxy-L-arabinose transferase-like glycosyltransferase
MILAGIGLAVAFLMPPPFGFLGFIILGLAYFLPSIKAKINR